MDGISLITGSILAILLFTSFVKILTALNILRYGVGLADAPFGVALIAVALALSAVVMEPVFSNAGGLQKAIQKGIDTAEADKLFRPFLEKYTDKNILARLEKVADKVRASPKASTGSSFQVLAAAFLVSELKAAFAIGLIFLIPFLVIDLVVANVLAALGVVQLTAAVVSLPLKLLLFVAVDAWGLIVDKLLLSYAG